MTLAATAATLIDGKKIAAQIRQAVADEVAALVAAGHRPGLAVILVGDDPASRVYVRNKIKQTTEVGMASFEHRLPASTTEAELLALIALLNRDDQIDGILVQLPLPAQIDERTVLRAIDPAKDVDGFHPVNVGLLTVGEDVLVPCTPTGAMALIRSIRPDLAGLNALVIGRSNIVGKPMASLLLAANCTVTVAHSRTSDLPQLCRSADIVVAAVGIPEMVRGEWVKDGAIVIDVGINRVNLADGGTRLVGDVEFAGAAQRAGAITPVPGGVGPMTIACLLQNTIRAARRRMT